MAPMADERQPEFRERSSVERAVGRLRRELRALEPLVDEARAAPRAQQARRALTRIRQTGARLAHSPDEQLERIAQQAVAEARRSVERQP